MDRDVIKNRLQLEATAPGITQTEKVLKDDKKVNDKYYKEVEKKMGEYEKATTQSGKESIEPVMDNYTDDAEKTYHDDMEIMNGQEMLSYDSTPSEEFTKRAKMSLEGDALMGNSAEYANVVEKGQGGDPDYGKTLVARIKDSKAKRDAATPALDQFGDDIEEKNVGVACSKGAIKPAAVNKKVAVESKQENKKVIMENTKKIKRLKFKNEIGGVENAKTIIPESYKVDKKVFEVTDGNENYRFRWEGDAAGAAVTLRASDKEVVSEDMAHIKHLMGFKPDLGRLNPTERLNESTEFTKLFHKVISESVVAEGEIAETLDADDCPCEIEKQAAQKIPKRVKVTEGEKRKVLTEISDEKKKEHARDQHHHSDYPEGVVPDCCPGASFVDGDRCSKCKEHASPAKLAEREGSSKQG